MQRATNLNFQYMFMTVFTPILCRPKNNWYLYVFKTNPLPPESKCTSRLFSQDVWSLGPSDCCFVVGSVTSSVVFSVLLRTGRHGVFPLLESMDSCFGCSLTLESLLEGIFMDWMGLVDLHRFTLGYFPTQNDRTTIWGVLFRGYVCKGSFATGMLGEVLHPVAKYLEEMIKVYSKPIYEFV